MGDRRCARGLAALGRSAVLVDVDDVAAMVAGPGAAAAGLWFAAHQAHGALVGAWMQTSVDVVIASGPIYTLREQAALLEPLPEASAVHWVVVDAPVAVTLARAQAEPGRGLSREPGFHGEAHRRFRQLLPEIPAAQTFDSERMSAQQIASAVLDGIGIR